MQIAHIPQPRLSSDQASARTLQRRNQLTASVIEAVSGTGNEAITAQTSAFVKTFPEDQRKKIVGNLRNLTAIPPVHVAALKSSLNIPWNTMREISRWLRTFDVKLASEKTARSVAKTWVGHGLVVESAPLTTRVPGNKELVIELRPWGYMYNLVAHVLHRLDELDKEGMLFNHPFIPSDEIQIKVGGDHGDTSFKMSYQIANVQNPNRKENTVVFSIFEAKDTRANLKSCLLRFKAQVNMLGRTKWRNKKLRVFMFGDYEFLCTMYGLSGPNGKNTKLYFEKIIKVKLLIKKLWRK